MDEQRKGGKPAKRPAEAETKRQAQNPYRANPTELKPSKAGGDQKQRRLR